MPEFTGERVVPGLVDANLLNEHFARYQLALRWCPGRRVLDAGCGTGYGSAELARSAASVIGIDFSEEAISYAKDHFREANLEFRIGDCLRLPDGPFDLIVTFEVIEHLVQWRDFLQEVRRALAPDGLFLVSTPNKLYYAESRAGSGANPFHVHEFEYAEYLAELRTVFPYVGMLLQNHVEGVAFANPENPVFQSKVESHAVQPEDSHFFLAVCGISPMPELEGFCWIPGTGNILREREHHIALLTGEVQLKTEWLERSRNEIDERNREYDQLLSNFRALNAQLEERNRWAAAAWEEAERRGARVLELQRELASEKTKFTGIAAAYESKIAELDETNRAKTEWALETERRLSLEIDERSLELASCVDLLNQAERTVVERTHWAQSLQKDLTERDVQLSALRSANWVKAGARLKLVPEP